MSTITLLCPVMTLALFQWATIGVPFFPLIYLISDNECFRQSVEILHHLVNVDQHYYYHDFMHLLDALFYKISPLLLVLFIFMKRNRQTRGPETP